MVSCCRVAPRHSRFDSRFPSAVVVDLFLPRLDKEKTPAARHLRGLASDLNIAVDLLRNSKVCPLRAPRES